MATFKTKAAIGDGKGKFSIEEIEVAEPQSDEVLVEMKAAGLCHTDWDSLSWKRPLVLGHEGAGVVKAVGGAIRHVVPGDPVLLNWAIPCGECFQCMLGNHSLCETSRPATVFERTAGHAHPDGTLRGGQPIDRSFNLGTLSGLALVRGPAVTRIDRNIPFPSACIVGCGVMTGYGSVVNTARVQAGTSVVVLGVGGVGLNAVQGARIAGASQIIAVARKAHRLETAKKFGATHTIQVQPGDDELIQAAAEARRLTGGRGADYCFESTANPKLGAAPLAFVRNGGMAVQMSGIEERISFDMRLFEWDKIYINPLYGKCTPGIDFPRIFDLYRQGKLLLDDLVTRTYPLESLGQAFEDMLQGKNCKGVITF
jgi:S-(hydroxymethyl)glutathione dehydrogenase / alcohol dehydrogenase